MTLATCGEESNDCWYMEIADRPMAGSRPLFLPGVRLHMRNDKSLVFNLSMNRRRAKRYT